MRSGDHRCPTPVLAFALGWLTWSAGVEAGGPPVNDECAGREVLPCNDSVTVDTLPATHGANDPNLSCSGTDEPCTVFYEFVPSQTSARIRTDLSSTASDSVYALHAVDQLDVCNQSLWTEVGCSEDEGIGDNGDLCFDNLTAGDTYILMLTGYSALTSCGEYTVDVECPCVVAPPNDDCAGREVLSCNDSLTVDTLLATHGANDPDLSCSSTDEPCTVFYEFVPSQTSARIRTDLSSTASDSVYALYAVDQLDVCNQSLWTEVGCSEDEGIGENGDLCFDNLTAGDTYILMLTGYSASASCGEYTADVECPCVVAPLNDDCAGREVLPCNDSVTVGTFLATHGANDPDLSCSSTDEPCTVFYEFVPSQASARFRTDLSSTASDSVYALYAVDQLDVCNQSLWTEVDCSEDEGIGENGDLCFANLTAGDTYILMLTGFSASTSCGEYTVDVECPCVVAPPNDDCAGREVLSCNDSVTVDTLPATHGANDPDLSCSGTDEPCTVFYEFVPSQTSARIRTDLFSTASDSVYALYAVDQSDVCNQSLWTEVDCSEDEGIGENGDLCFDNLTSGDTYILMLTGFSASTSCGEYAVDVECPCVVAPPNDDCAGREVLSCNDSVTVDTLPATHGANDPDLSCSSTDEPCTVFYEFVPSQTSARIRTDLSSTASDSVYALYAVDQLDICNQSLWTEVDCSEDEGIGDNGDLCFDNLTAGDTYILMLTGYSASASCGEYTVDVNCPCPGVSPIPAVSEWGMIVLAALVLMAGALVISQRRRWIVG